MHLYVCVSDMVRDWELYGVHQELDPQVKLQKLAEAERILGWMRNLDLSPKEPLATDESSQAHECEIVCLCLFLTEFCLCMCSHSTSTFICLIVVLRRVRHFEKTLMTTQGRLLSMREVLGRFTFRLFQAQDLLNKAEDTLQQTLDKYKTNQLKLQRREVPTYTFPVCYENINH